jgi:D-3-phosphoglycerate dehydrogenase
MADLDRNGLRSAVKDVDVLWVGLRHRIDASVMAGSRRLKIIVTPTTGLDHIDLNEARTRGITVLSLRGEVDFLQEVRATAEHTIALILAMLRHVPAALDHVLGGTWDRHLFRGHELYGKTVGIVGYGRLGRTVGRYLRVFDTRILAADPSLDLDSLEPGVALLPLHHVLQQADLVTLHVNLCEQTCGFFGRNEFLAMKEGAWFINTSRGELVDEDALLDALRAGRLSGAALDVLCEERSDSMADHPLVVYAREHDHLIITPHISGCTAESMEKTEFFMAKKLCTVLPVELLNHEPPVGLDKGIPSNRQPVKRDHP